MKPKIKETILIDILLKRDILCILEQKNHEYFKNSRMKFLSLFTLEAEVFLNDKIWTPGCHINVYYIRS